MEVVLKTILGLIVLIVIALVLAGAVAIMKEGIFVFLLAVGAILIAYVIGDAIGLGP